MKVARYLGQGQVGIVADAEPSLPPGGLIVRTEACGLCSGELMAWYMDQKIPHVLGHEVAGIVEASEDARFPVGARVFPHHHAPCGECEMCRLGRPVHCETWRRTKLIPGGMAERFAVPAANLADTLLVDDLRAVDAALIEPLACVEKSIRLSRHPEGAPYAVIGLGVMGLMHLLALRGEGVGIDLNPARVEWARGLGLRAESVAPEGRVETVFVCPGSQAAFEAALAQVRPGGTIVMFAPLAPGEALRVPQEVYFRDLALVHAYSCGPENTRVAADWLREGRLRAEDVCSSFIPIEELPAAYVAMKTGRILKPMVVF